MSAIDAVKELRKTTWRITAEQEVAAECIPASATQYSDGDECPPTWLSRGRTALDAVKALVGVTHHVSSWEFGSPPLGSVWVCVRAHGVGEPSCFEARPLRGDA